MIKLLILSMAIGGASFAYSATLKEADALFQQRETKALEAREAYKAAAEGLTGADKVYAINQMARADYYRGAIALPDPEDVEFNGDVKKEKYSIFEQCVNDVEEIKVEPGKSFYKEYLSARLLCFTFMAQNGSTLQRARNLRPFKDLLDAVEKTFVVNGLFYTELEGNILRYLASVRISTDGVGYGLFNRKQAVDIAELLLKGPSKKDRGYQVELGTADYYENHYTVADILSREDPEDAEVKYQQKDRALAMLVKAIKTIDLMKRDGKLNGGRGLETARQRERLFRLCNTIEVGHCQ